MARAFHNESPVCRGSVALLHSSEGKLSQRLTKGNYAKALELAHGTRDGQAHQFAPSDHVVRATQTLDRRPPKGTPRRRQEVEPRGTAIDPKLCVSGHWSNVTS